MLLCGALQSFVLVHEEMSELRCDTSWWKLSCLLLSLCALERNTATALKSGLGLTSGVPPPPPPLHLCLSLSSHSSFTPSCNSTEVRRIFGISQNLSLPVKQINYCLNWANLNLQPLTRSLEVSKSFRKLSRDLWLKLKQRIPLSACGTGSFWSPSCHS